MSEAKFCKDCKWCKPWYNPMGWLFARPDYALASCINPKLGDNQCELMAAGKVRDGYPCAVARDSRFSGGCGSEAKLFEKKP